MTADRPTTEPRTEAGQIIGCNHIAWGSVAECPYCGIVNDMVPKAVHREEVAEALATDRAGAAQGAAPTAAELRIAYNTGRSHGYDHGRSEGATPRAEVVLAHCPHCNGDGCDVCYGTGQTEVAAPLSPIGDNLADTIAERRARRGAIPATEAGRRLADAAHGLTRLDKPMSRDKARDLIRAEVFAIEAEARVHALGEGFVRGVNAEAKAQGAAPRAECRCTEPEKWGHDSTNHPECEACDTDTVHTQPCSAPRAEGLPSDDVDDLVQDIAGGIDGEPYLDRSGWERAHASLKVLASAARRPSDERDAESEEPR